MGSPRCWQKLTHYTDCECDVLSGHLQGVQFSHQSFVPPNILKKPPLNLVAASCSRSSENQYSCTLTSQPSKISRIYIFSVTKECPSWTQPPQCLRVIQGILALKVLLQILFQAFISFCVISYDHIIHIPNQHGSLLILYLPKHMVVFCAQQRPNFWITNSKRSKQALGYCFRL